MLDKVGIVTDNFFKFLTTLSLVTFIYCSSFDTLFLSPYNKQIIDNNIETCKLGAERGYLTGISKDLTTLISDSVRKHNVVYFYYNKKDTSDYSYYYCSLNLDSSRKRIVDSLNLTNKKLAEKAFLIKTIEDANKILEANIKIRGWIMNIVGALSLITFLLALYNWYKLRAIIDN